MIRLNEKKLSAKKHTEKLRQKIDEKKLDEKKIKKLPDPFGSYYVSREGKVYTKSISGRALRTLRMQRSNNRGNQRMVKLYEGKPGNKKEMDKYRFYNIAELVAMAFLGMKPLNYEVCYRDKNPGNARVRNLYYRERTITIGAIEIPVNQVLYEINENILKKYPEKEELIDHILEKIKKRKLTTYRRRKKFYDTLLKAKSKK